MKVTPRDLDFRRMDDSSRPREIQGLKDNDKHVVFVDVILRIQRNENPWPAIMRGLMELRDNEDVLLVRHNLNAVLLREKFAKCGFASWAEERRIGEWYIYFFRPTASAGAVAQSAMFTVSSQSALAAGA